MQKSFLKSSGTVTALTFLSRIFGLLRDYTIARFFGANMMTDAFLVAFRIPNFFRRLFAEGAFSQALVPILAETRVKDENEVQTVINHIATRLFIILTITTVIAVIAAPVIIFLFAWGFYFADDPTQFRLASDMLRITFPYLLFISLTAFSGAILNTYNRFSTGAFTPVLLNIAIILAAIFLAQYLDEPIMALAWGVFIGGVLQLVYQIPFLRRIRRLPKIAPASHPVFQTLRKRMLPALFGVSVSQINLLIDTMIASTLIAGSVSWLYYSDRLLELPLGLIGIALGTVALPSLSRHFAANEREKFERILNDAFKIGLIFGVPACLGLVFFAEPLIIMLFQYDAFDAHASAMSAKSLVAYGLGLLALIGVKILLPAFFARGDTKTPVKIGVLVMLINVVLNIILSRYYQHVGLALATSIAAFVNVALLYRYLSKNQIFKLERAFFPLLFKTVFAGVIMTIFLLGFSAPAAEYLMLDVGRRILSVGFFVASSAILYFACLRLLGVRFKKL